MSNAINATLVESVSKLPEYINIPAFLLQDARLNEGECLLYGFLLSFALNRKACRMYNSYLARVFNKSIDTIKRRIKNLEDCGFIQRYYIGKRRYLRVIIVDTPIDYPDEDNEGHDLEKDKNNPEGGCKSARGGVQICTTDNNIDNKEKIIKDLGPSGQKNAPSVPENDNFSELFDRFYKAYPRKKKPEDAKKAFRQVTNGNPTSEFVDMLVNDIDLRKKHDWLNRPKDKISYPASYLRSREFEGEIEYSSAVISNNEELQHHTNDWLCQIQFPSERKNSSIEVLEQGNVYDA